MNSYFRVAIATIILMLVLGDVWYIHHLKSELATCTTRAASLQANLDMHNAAIVRMKADADARDAHGKQVIQKAQVDADALKSKAKDVQKVQPSTPGNDCKSALDEVNND